MLMYHLYLILVEDTHKKFIMEANSKKEREAALNRNRVQNFRGKVYNNNEMHKKIKLIDKLQKKVERENAKVKDMSEEKEKIRKKECE